MRASLVLALALVVPAASPVQAAPPLVVSVGGPAEDPAYLPVYAAAALGVFEAEGVQPTLRRGRHPTAAVDALREREVGVAVTTLDQAIRGGWARGTPVRILIAHTRAPGAAFLASTAAGNRVARVEDLRGKRVGIPGPGTTGHLLLLALLRSARLEPWQMDLQSFGGASLLTRLASGDLAAAVAGEPWAGRALAAGAATALLDFRRPEEADRALGGPFYEIVSVVRSEPQHEKTEKGAKGGKAEKGRPAPTAEAPADEALAAFARALIRVQAWLRVAPAGEVADRLPALAAARERFVARLRTVQEAYTADGEATAAGLEATLRVLRGGNPWPVSLKIEPGDLREPEFIGRARASLLPHPPPP